MSTPTQKHPARRLTLCAMLAAVLCALSPIALPIGPIPISLGLLGVLLAAVFLPPSTAIASVAIFLALGACGLPVFGNGMGGATALVGPTGGYLWAYLLVCPLVSWLSGKASRLLECFLACLTGVALCYLCGTLQFILVTQTPLQSAITLAVLPFLPFDILKALLASYLGTKLKERIQI